MGKVSKQLPKHLSSVFFLASNQLFEKGLVSIDIVTKCP